MQIKIINNEGFHRLFNGDIEYHNNYISIKYRIPNDKSNWIDLAMPWRIIDEVEVKP